MQQSDSYDHFFLGPKSELRPFLKEVIDLAVDDYIYWRRNFHPKDPPAISYSALHTPDAEAHRGRFHQELFELISDLKLDVPFFSPRYMAHMVSEVAVPGLVAYLATLLYNPNNVSQEASPVTAAFEVEVGRQFAELFGYDPESAFGHLCAGGTIANYESLWLNRAGRFLPVAMALAADAESLPRPEGLPKSLWGLLNLPYDQIAQHLEAFVATAERHDRNAQELLRRWDIGAFGDAEYRSLVEERFGETYGAPAVLVPQTAHYGWRRAASVLGFGRNQLLEVAVDVGFRMRPDDFRRRLDQCLDEHRPVLQSVFVLGTTEFGSVDPLPALFEARDGARLRGLESPVHVDAAYGGYFATIFRGRPKRQERQPFAWMPTLERLRSACAELRRAESITVDPHKMGYAPYGAGALVIRHGFLRHLQAEGAPYALDSSGSRHEDLGKVILEGSKPGAAAAAVWFNHRMMPLAADGYGSLLLDLCLLAQVFHAAALARDAGLAAEDAPVRLLTLRPPDTNIVCLLALPAHAHALGEIDDLNRKLALRFGVREVESIQSYDYLVSKTRFDSDLAFVREHPLLTNLKRDRDSLTCLRLVFMNRWVAGDNAAGRPYVDDFLDVLVTEAIREIAADAAPADVPAGKRTLAKRLG